MASKLPYDNLPVWVQKFAVFPVPPETDYTTRARIAGTAQKPDAKERFASCRQLMTRLDAHNHCPRKACARANQCASAYACCMWENIDAMQKLVFPKINAMLAETGGAEADEREE